MEAEVEGEMQLHSTTTAVMASDATKTTTQQLELSAGNSSSATPESLRAPSQDHRPVCQLGDSWVSLAKVGRLGPGDRMKVISTVWPENTSETVC